MTRIGSLCTGYGGLDLAVQAVFGGELAWWSDIEPGPIKVMTHHHPDVPNLGDLKTVDWSTVDGIDILTTGYPCQPFSNAGKRLGTEDPRHLWPWIADAIGVLRPRIVVLENVAAHLRRGFDIVSADLAGLGYCFSWGIVSAAEAGAPHLRKRLYVVAADTSRELDDRRGTLGPQGRVEPTDRSHVTADAYGQLVWEQPRGGSRTGREDTAVARGGSEAIADAPGIGWQQGRSESTGQLWRPNATNGRGDAATSAEVQDWLEWADAIERWEDCLDAEAPVATIENPRAKLGRSLNPRLPEWMMGVPGRITSVPGLDRNEQIKLAGNGVVPQQAILAIRELYTRLVAHLDTEAAA